MDSGRKIKMSELKKNNGVNGNRLWVLIDNKIYDVTDFAHPGGNEILLDDHGTDRIDEFEVIHSPAAKKQTNKYLIGEIDTTEDGDNIVTDKKTDEIKINKKKRSSESFLMIILIFLFLCVGFVIYKKLLAKK
jgi:cytochrome b involved in lipid metabolism